MNRSKNLVKIAALLLLSFGPFLAFAAAPVPTGDLISILGILGPIIKTLILIVFSVAFLGFLWGITTFIWNAGNEKKRAQGKNVMIWGIITLFVALSIYGIVGLLQTTLDIGNVPLTVPCPTEDQNC